jgi:hypothetical protein
MQASGHIIDSAWMMVREKPYKTQPEDTRTANKNLILDGWIARKGISSIQNKKNAKRSLDVMPALAGR